jgi:hypothetical protein
MGRDPPTHALSELALDMQDALKLPAPKDTTVLVPLFESEASRARRLAAERQHREVLKRQKTLHTQRLILAGKPHGLPEPHLSNVGSAQQVKSLLAQVLGRGSTNEQQSNPAAFVEIDWSAKDTVSSTSLPEHLSTVLASRSRKRKAETPIHLATAKTFSSARQVLDRWMEAADHDERVAVEAATRANFGMEAKKRAIVRKTDTVITSDTIRLYRHDALAAGESLVIWDMHSAAAGILHEWIDTSVSMLQHSINHVGNEFRQLFRQRGASKDDPFGAQPNLRKLMLLKSSLAGHSTSSGHVPKKRKRRVADATAADGVETMSEEPLPVKSGSAATTTTEFPLSPAESYGMLLRGLSAADTAHVGGWMQLVRFLKAVPDTLAVATPYMAPTVSGTKRKRG